MLELDQSKKVSGEELVFDANEENFIDKVVEASKSLPVIVDFWAPWCGPCKTLGPALESAVKAAKGAIKMAKVNVDENQMIASQLRVQTIPTVFAFWQGQPIDAFQGAIPESEIKAFITKTVESSGGKVDDGISDAIVAAEELLEAGSLEDAEQIYSAVLGEEPDNPAASSGLIRVKIAQNDLDDAEAILNGLVNEISSTPEIESAAAQLELAKQAEQAGPIEELKGEMEKNPGNHQARLEYANALYAANKVEEAIAELLELFRRDREWQDGAAKRQLFIIFEALKPNDPVVLEGRRKLSSMIFV